MIAALYRLHGRLVDRVFSGDRWTWGHQIALVAVRWALHRHQRKGVER